MTKVEKKLLNKVLNQYIWNYCYTGRMWNEFKDFAEHKIVGDVCAFMKKYKI